MNTARMRKACGHADGSLTVSRNASFGGQVRASQFLKMTDQMYCMLAICQTLLPQRLEENVENLLKEKQGENMERVLRTYVVLRCLAP